MLTTLFSTLLAQNPLGGDKPITGPIEGFNPDPALTGAAIGGTPIEKFFSVLLGFFTIIGGLMFLVYFIFAGLTWITSGGEKGKVESSKNQMTNAAIGLAIVLIAHAIVSIVGGVLGLNILQPVQMLQALWN